MPVWVIYASAELKVSTVEPKATVHNGRNGLACHSRGINSENERKNVYNNIWVGHEIVVRPFMHPNIRLSDSTTIDNLVIVIKTRLWNDRLRRLEHNFWGDY